MCIDFGFVVPVDGRAIHAGNSNSNGRHRRIWTRSGSYTDLKWLVWSSVLFLLVRFGKFSTILDCPRPNWRLWRWSNTIFTKFRTRINAPPLLSWNFLVVSIVSGPVANRKLWMYLFWHIHLHTLNKKRIHPLTYLSCENPMNAKLLCGDWMCGLTASIYTSTNL
jgi:hypothetical protein